MPNLHPRHLAGLTAAAICFEATADVFDHERRGSVPAARLRQAAGAVGRCIDGRLALDGLRAALHDCETQLERELAPGAAVWSVTTRRHADAACEVLQRAGARTVTAA